MKWDWSAIGKVVGTAAPMIGTLLAGPAGATVGAMVAAALDTEATPEAVAAAISKKPEDLYKLRTLEKEQGHELQKLILQSGSQDISAVNETMRTEAQSDKWYVGAWRPFWGFTSAIAFFVQTGYMGYLAATNPEKAVTVITALAGLDGYWLVPLAVLGVASWHRGQERRAKAGDTRPLFSWGSK